MGNVVFTVGGANSEVTVRVLLSPPLVELASPKGRRLTFQHHVERYGSWVTCL